MLWPSTVFGGWEYTHILMADACIVGLAKWGNEVSNPNTQDRKESLCAWQWDKLFLANFHWKNELRARSHGQTYGRDHYRSLFWGPRKPKIIVVQILIYVYVFVSGHSTFRTKSPILSKFGMNVPWVIHQIKFVNRKYWFTGNSVFANF